MKRMLVALVAISLLPAEVAAQTIRAKDGDTVLVENNDKVKIVRRRHANVRVLYNAEQQWVLVLADWLSVPGGGDGRVDFSFSFRELTGAWPLAERWEGTVYLDEYEMAGPVMRRGMGLTTSSGLIQFLGFAPEGRTMATDKTFADPAAVAVLTFRGSGSSMEREAFDVAEQRALTRMAQEAAGRPVTGPGGIRSSVSLSVEAQPASGYQPSSQPVRVGGNIRAPIKTKHVDGVLPGAARQAGVFGMVIVEIIIGTDGTVQSAKVLRSIPMLDQAAIDAVKQWIYEPTLLNGVPVPVIMTATVNFTQ
jgi:TonB family protein